MFENLTERLSRTLSSVTGKARLTDENITETLREVRLALLEADVALPVVKDFIERIRERAVGTEVGASLTAGQTLVGIVNDELTAMMGAENSALNLSTKPPAVVLMAGLQGAGKTTTAAKLARTLGEQRRKVAMVSTDVYRPAAIEQLRTLAAEVGANYLPSSADERPLDIARRALDEARIAFADVLIVDTAGRLSIDDAMMAEIGELQRALEPAETLFVVDAMTGQDAATTARAFSEAIDLTGVVLAKADGDARGGAALSVRAITGKPIKFLGVGEQTDALEAFHPDRIASRILGMGDMLSLIEEAERKLDRRKADRLASKLRKGQKFDLYDFRDQLQQMTQIGGMSAMLDRLPGMQGVNLAEAGVDERGFKRMEVVIDSMTDHERRFPDVLNGSRKRRIAKGSGTELADINRLMKQHRQMQKVMKKMSRKGGMERMARGLGAMTGGGGMPAAQRTGGKRRRPRR